MPMMFFFYYYDDDDDADDEDDEDSINISFSFFIIIPCHRNSNVLQTSADDMT